MPASLPVWRIGPEKLAVGAVGYGAMSFGEYYGQGGYDKDRAAGDILDRVAERGRRRTLRAALDAVASAPANEA